MKRKIRSRKSIRLFAVNEMRLLPPPSVNRGRGRNDEEEIYE